MDAYLPSFGNAPVAQLVEQRPRRSCASMRSRHSHVRVQHKFAGWEFESLPVCHFLNDPFLAERHTRCAQNAVSLRHPGSSPGEGTNLECEVMKPLHIRN
jgi:hypothetical protein